MSNPTASSVVFTAGVELHDVGMFGGTLHGARVAMHFNGTRLGFITMPTVAVAGGTFTPFTLASRVDVSDAAAFTAATAAILQGKSSTWVIKGGTTIDARILGVARTFSVTLDQAVALPATLLEQVRGTDMRIVPGSGTPHSIGIAAVASYFSSSILEVEHMGAFTFELLLPREARADRAATATAGEDEDGAALVKVAEVVFPDFTVRRGYNSLPVNGTIVRTRGNAAVLERFVSAFLDGDDQGVTLRGPIASASPFLNRIVTQRLTFAGLPGHNIVLNSLMSKEGLNGFTQTLPGGASVSYRGTTVTARNPFAIDVRLQQVTMDVRLAEPLGYTVDNTLVGKHACPVSDDFVTLYTAPGMYNKAPSRPPVIALSASETKSFFLAARPIEGQNKGPACKLPLGIKIPHFAWDCCFLSLFTAAACKAACQGSNACGSKDDVGDDDNFFLVNFTGKFLLAQGAFNINVTATQALLPTVFTQDLLDGWLLDAGLKCSEYTFE